MPRLYRRRETLEAIQFDGTNAAAVAAFVGPDRAASDPYAVNRPVDTITIYSNADPTRERHIHVGDWIVKDSGNWVSAIGDRTFAECYEAIDSESERVEGA